MSSLGMGTYLGEADSDTDTIYIEATMAALRSGINVLDAAINYRHQRSERNLGTALKKLTDSKELQRDEVVVCTKAGYLSFDGDMPADPHAYFRETYMDTGILDPKDVVGMNCMAPGYLADQLERCHKNLGLETIDVFYLHNPESHLTPGVSRNEYLAKLRPSFQMLEEAVLSGKISYYGAATWNGFRLPPDAPGAMNILDLVGMARELAGEDHHFRFIQLPFNLAMREGWELKNQSAGEKNYSVFEVAERVGVTVVGSATLYQGSLTAKLPEPLKKILGMASDAASAIQFARSAPGITTSLIGMSKKHHVEENLKVAAHKPVSREVWEGLLIETKKELTAQGI